jgi:hypothetical protein
MITRDERRRWYELSEQFPGTYPMIPILLTELEHAEQMDRDWHEWSDRIAALLPTRYSTDNEGEIFNAVKDLAERDVKLRAAVELLKGVACDDQD